MKLLKNIIYILFTSVILSCSSDNNSSTNSPTTYYPITAGNYWNYKVSTSGNDLFDKLTVGNEVTVNSKTYNAMIGLSDPTNASNTPNGYYCNTLNNNNLRVDGSSLKLTGNLNFNFPGLTTPIIINVDNFTLFDQNANSGIELSTINGTIEQTISSIPITINYILKSVADVEIPNITVPAGTFTAKKAKLILNIKITTEQTFGGVPVTIAILDPQDVVVSSMHYADGVGMIYNNTVFSYNLSSAATLLLPAGTPTSQSIIQEESLTGFLAN